VWTNIYCGPAPTPPSIWRHWNLDPWLILALVVLFAVHAATLKRETDGGAQRLCLAGAWSLAALLFVSPLCALTSALFSARIGHHVLLVAGVAPLLVLALPRRLRLTPSRPTGQIAVLAAAHAAIVWLWHAPLPYAAALSDTALYWVMELSLLISAVLLWRAVLSPAAGLGAVVAALIATVAQMGLLGALITFARTPLYEAHFLTAEPWGLSALEDQQLAGLIMWIPAAAPYAIAGLLLVARQLVPSSSAARVR
jgi:putative membrane protein